MIYLIIYWKSRWKIHEEEVQKNLIIFNSSSVCYFVNIIKEWVRRRVRSKMLVMMIVK